MSESYRVTEWDEGPDAGSYVFEITGQFKTVYVVRFMDGTYKHMDSSFTDITETLPTALASMREIVVASYMAQNIKYFTLS